jgi:hypothetical protein
MFHLESVQHASSSAITDQIELVLLQPMALATMITVEALNLPRINLFPSLHKIVLLKEISPAISDRAFHLRGD